MSVTQQQLAYLNAMGISVWVSRHLADPAIFEAISNKTNEDDIQQKSPSQTAPPAIQIPSHNNPPPPAYPSAPPPEYSTENLFNEIDQTTHTPPPKNATAIAESLSAKTTTEKLVDCSNFDWQQLQTTAINCQQCELYNKRTQIVFDEGARNATWMIIGDAPKEEEDTQGRPFMDRSGLLLNKVRPLHE